MAFEKHFTEQLKKHPSMQYQDAVKLCYQAAYGAEHLLSDTERARVYLLAELEQVDATDEPLFEMISDEVCRVNLGAWKREGMPPEALFNAFVSSCTPEKDADIRFESFIDIAERVMAENIHGFEPHKWRDFLEKYKKDGNLPIHHSDIYRKHEKPSYRIVKIGILEKILH